MLLEYGRPTKTQSEYQLMASTRSSTPVAILFVAVLILIYTTFPILLPLHFAQAQNSTGAQNITYQGIPTTISKEAQEELRMI
jgi:hypothetical protein